MLDVIDLSIEFHDHLVPETVNPYRQAFGTASPTERISPKIEKHLVGKV